MSREGSNENEENTSTTAAEVSFLFPDSLVSQLHSFGAVESKRTLQKYEATCLLLYSDPTHSEYHPYLKPLMGLPSDVEMGCRCHQMHEGPLSSDHEFNPSTQAVYGGLFLPSTDQPTRRRPSVWDPFSSSPLDPEEKEPSPLSRRNRHGASRRKKEKLTFLSGEDHPATKEEQKKACQRHYPRYLYHYNGHPSCYTFVHSRPSSPYLHARCSCSPPFPPSRSGHVMAWMKDYILIFGGLGDEKATNDTWAFYPNTRQFRELCPPPGASHQRRDYETEKEGGTRASRRIGGGGCMEIESCDCCGFMKECACTPRKAFGQTFAVFYPRPSRLTGQALCQQNSVNHHEETPLERNTAPPAETRRKASTSTSTTDTSSLSMAPTNQKRSPTVARDHPHLFMLGGFTTSDEVLSEAYIFCGKTEQWMPAKFSTVLPPSWGSTAQALRQPRVLPIRCPRCDRWKHPRRSRLCPTSSLYDYFAFRNPSTLEAFWFHEIPMGKEEEPSFSASSSVCQCPCETPRKHTADGGWIPRQVESSEEEDEEEVVVLFGGMANPEVLREMYIFHLERPLEEEDIPLLSHLILTGFYHFSKAIRYCLPPVEPVTTFPPPFSSFSFPEAIREGISALLHDSEGSSESEERNDVPSRPRAPPATCVWMEAQQRMLRQAVGTYLVEVIPIRVKDQEGRKSSLPPPSWSSSSSRMSLEQMEAAYRAGSSSVWSTFPPPPRPRGREGAPVPPWWTTFPAPPPPSSPPLSQDLSIRVVAPPPRRRPCSAAYRERWMMVFGGRDEDTFYNDLWAFDSFHRSWHLVSPGTPKSTTTATGMTGLPLPTASNFAADAALAIRQLLAPPSVQEPAQPSPRTGACMAIDEANGFLLIYGGFLQVDSGMIGFMNGDFYVFELHSKKWQGVWIRQQRAWNPFLDFGPTAGEPACASIRDPLREAQEEQREEDDVEAGTPHQKDEDTVGSTPPTKEDKKEEVTEAMRVFLQETIASLPSASNPLFDGFVGVYEGRDHVEDFLTGDEPHSPDNANSHLMKRVQRAAEREHRSAMLMEQFTSFDSYLSEMLHEGGKELAALPATPKANLLPILPLSSSSASSPSSSLSSLSTSYRRNVVPFHYRSFFSSLFSTSAEKWSSHYLHLPVVSPIPSSMSALVAVPIGITDDGEEEGRNGTTFKRFFLFGGRNRSSSYGEFFEIIIRPTSAEQNRLDSVSEEFREMFSKAALKHLVPDPPSPPPEDRGERGDQLADVVERNLFHKIRTPHKKTKQEKCMELCEDWWRLQRKCTLRYMEKLSTEEETFFSNITLSSQGLWASTTAWLNDAMAKPET